MSFNAVDGIKFVTFAGGAFVFPLTSPDWTPLEPPLTLASVLFLATSFCNGIVFLLVLVVGSGEFCFFSLHSWEVVESESLDDDESEPLEEELLLELSLLEAEELSVELRVPG